MKSIVALTSLLSLTTAAVIPNSLTRRADLCDQYGQSTEGDFILYNNAWGKDNADSGSQCTGLDSVNGDTISWHATWSWEGGDSSVKSFPNAAYQFDAKTLDSVSSMTTKWEWSYTGSDLVADVAYDMFLSSSADGDAEYEIMVWLAALGGAGPISSTGQSIATTTIGGTSFELWSGKNGNMQVYSFVASSEAQNFSGDLLEFFQYLEQNQGLQSSLYLTDVQAGTEPFTGSNAKFTTSTYSVTVA
ncbi:putative xyloglucan-specific endo-beta-1,4-glucanase A [Aspergillus cristatus]|uniref:xyloglucan-specific endo-beta-1,4-glucanase n=1 Tax=Aspergillus cristatus TaxID=573508 RepID=A0A1E3BSN5_ASPCR|nr:putative xyloglucan-specific endo-beta-1,4-glucanase A [Aspergillus cristatus]